MGRRLALIIGNSAYRDGTLTRLLTPDIDVGALAEILLDPEVGAFDDAKVLVNMTSATVRRAIADFFTQKSREDLLLLYFSGHGVLDDRGRLHLAVKDTDHSLLRGTAVSAGFIVDEMDNSRSQRQVLILDCCHSGAFARGTKGSPGITVGTASAFEGTGFGRVVLTATDATQYAWEGDRVIGEAESSLFTHYMVQGLQSGEADINGDGQITIDELYDYVYAQVVQQTPKQTPGKWSFKEQGEIIIARASSTEGARPIVEVQPFIDVELQKKLQQLYTKGLSAYWLEEWEQAAHNFQLILEINPDYQDAAEKFAEVRRQLKLKNLYDQALAAFEAQKFREAVTAFEALVAEAPDHKDAASKLQAARKQGKVADLYTQAKQLHQAGQWQAVIHISERIAELTPDFVDPEELLPTARHEFEGQKRLAEIKGRYQQALQAMNSGRWQEARNSFSQIQEQEPGFEDTDRLLARVDAEIAKQEAQRRVQERVGTLHEQAISLSRARQWRQALDKMKEIETLDPEFADPVGIAASAEAEIAREQQEAQRQNELAALYAEAVRLLKAGQYREALDKWGEVQAINPDYFDRHEVQTTARKKLAVRTKLEAGKPHLLTRNVAILGLLGLAFIAISIVRGSRGFGGLFPVASQTSAPALRAVQTSTQIPAKRKSLPTITSKKLASTITPTRRSPIATRQPRETAITYPIVYDFEDPRYDGTFDTSHWEVPTYSSSERSIAQENGVLNITIDQGEVGLSAKNFEIPSQEVASYIEVDIKLDSATSSGIIGVGIDTDHKTQIRCAIGHNGEATWKGCEFEKKGWKTEPLFAYSASLQKWYLFRFDINPLEKKIDILFDGKRVDSFQLTEAEKVSGFGLWGLAEKGPVKGYFDNVKIGLIDK